jgi:hypothetical protein
MTLLQRAGFNVTKGYLVAYFNQADVRTFEIEHDQKLAGQIERALRAYRPHLRDPKLPPKPKGADLTTVEHVEPKPGKVIDIDPMLVDSYLYAQGERKTAEEAERIHRVALEEAIGDAEEVTVRGTAIATWKSSTVNYQPKPASTVTRRTLRFKRNAAQILREAAGRPF